MHDDLQIEIVRGDEALDVLKSEWMELSTRAREHFCSQTFYWASHAWKHAVARGDCRLSILTGRDQGRLVLVWPFVLRRHLAWQEAEWLGATYEYRDVLVERSPVAGRWIDEAWGFLKTELGADLVSCPSIRPDAAVFPLLNKEASAVRRHWPILFIAADRWPDWDSYRQSLRAKFRRDQQRRRRRLAERGRVALEIAESGEQVDRLMGWLFAQKRAWALRHRLYLPWLESGAYEDFLHAAARDALGSDELWLGALKVNDQILAVQLAFVCRSRMELYMITYDRAWRSYGPGRLMLEEAVKWAFDNKISVVDFRTGLEPFKYGFANDETWRTDHLVPCGRWGACYVAWRRSVVRGVIARMHAALPAGVRRVLTVDDGRHR